MQTPEKFNQSKTVSPEKMPIVLQNIRKVLKERFTSKEQQISEIFYVRGDDGTRAYYFSWLTMQLLQQGDSVRATVRDPKNVTKVKHLIDLPGAKERLTLFKADLSDAIDGCVGVFHVAFSFLRVS